MPALAPLESHYDFARFGVSGVVVAVSLFILHMWLPAGRRGFGAVRPGILATMVLWLICGFTFGHYLAEFAYTYVNYYAGLASATAPGFLFTASSSTPRSRACGRRRRSSRHCEFWHRPFWSRCINCAGDSLGLGPVRTQLAIGVARGHG